MNAPRESEKYNAPRLANTYLSGEIRFEELADLLQYVWDQAQAKVIARMQFAPQIDGWVLPMGWNEFEVIYPLVETLPKEEKNNQ